MLPSIVVGVTAGAIVFQTFPPLYLITFLVIVMAILFVTTTNKLCKIRRAEKEKYGPLNCCGSKSAPEEGTDSYFRIQAEKPEESSMANPQLAKIIKQESTNFQWSKLALNYGMLAIMVILQLLRGPGSEPSIIDVNRCDKLDWVLLTALFLMCGLLTIVGCRMM